MPPPLIPINQNSITTTPLNLVSILQQSNQPIRAKNITIKPENIPELLKSFVLFKGIDTKSPLDKLFKMNGKGMPFLDIEFYGVPYRLTWNNSKKLIKINSSNKTSSKIENVTNQLKFLDKCGFVGNVKIFTDFSLTFVESNNTIIYSDDDTKQQITLTPKDNNTFLSEKCTINNTQGYLWYDTDYCEKIYFIVNNDNVYCYQMGNWEKITEYPQKLIDFIKKDSRPNINQNSKKKFAQVLVELLKKSKKNNNNKLSIIPKTQSSVLTPDLLQSVKDLLSNLPNLSKNQNQPPLNITAQISPNLFLIPYGETSIVVDKRSDQLIPFPLLYRDGFYYCKLWNLTLKITYDGSNYVFELKNEDGSNVPINPKLIGYNQEKAVEINNIPNSIQISSSEPKIMLTNTLQKISPPNPTQRQSIVPNLQKQLKNIRSQIPVNPQSSLQNTELIAKISENIIIIRRLNRYYVIFEHNGRHYEHELTKENNLLYCNNCSIQIQGKEQLFNFSYNLDTKEPKFEPIIQKRIKNNRVKEVKKFTEKLVELQNKPVQKGNKSLQLILYLKQQPFQFKINEELVESILKQNRNYGVLQDFPETSIQIAKNVFIVPFPAHQTNYLVVPKNTEEIQIFPFKKDANTGEVYCEYNFNGDIYTIIYRGKNKNRVILFDAKNKNGRNITMNRKRTGYNIAEPNIQPQIKNTGINLSNIKPIKYLNCEEYFRDNKIQITDNLYIEQNDDKYFLRGQILSSIGARAITLNEPMQKNDNILSTFLNGKQIKYDINRCKESGYNPFNKNNQVNNNLSYFQELLNKETNILDTINKNKSNGDILVKFINKLDQSYSKLKDNNKKKYEELYVKFKNKMISILQIKTNDHPTHQSTTPEIGKSVQNHIKYFNSISQKKSLSNRVIETGKKIGSYINAKWKKVTSKPPTSSTTSYKPLFNNFNN
jgi:hypothetical protein